MNGNDDNDKWRMKSDLCIDSHCISLSELGTHLSTVELVLLCFPFSCLHKQLDWTDVAGAGRGGGEKKQIGKKRPWLLTKCLTDVVQLSPASLHLMGTCAKTFPVGVNCSQCSHIMFFLQFAWFVWAGNVIYSQVNEVNNNKQHRNTPVIQLTL